MGGDAVLDINLVEELLINYCLTTFFKAINYSSPSPTWEIGYFLKY